MATLPIDFFSFLSGLQPWSRWLKLLETLLSDQTEVVLRCSWNSHIKFNFETKKRKVNC